MSDLVRRLCGGWHPVEVSLRPERTVRALKESLDRELVHVTFTDTRGVTEIGIPIDWDRSDITTADFDAGTGAVTLAGALSLDFVDVRCVVRIDLATLAGEGRLEPLVA